MPHYQVTATPVWSQTFTSVREAADAAAAEALVVAELRQMEARDLDPHRFPYQVIVCGAVGLEPAETPSPPPPRRFLVHVERRYREYFELEASTPEEAARRAREDMTSEEARERIEIEPETAPVTVLPGTGRRTRCDNCQSIWYETELDEVRDLEQRLDPGGEVPAGECPHCGALSYLEDNDASDP